MICLLAACEAAGAQGSGAPNPAHQPPANRWIHATWFGPPIINNAPTITLCPNGRYQTTHVFKAPPHARGMSVDELGLACCRDAEHGTYELTRDPRTRAITAVTFTPDSGAKHVGTVSATGLLDGFFPGPHAYDCR